jgi:hypothetical protein
MAQAMLRTTRIPLVPLCDDHLEHEVELDADPEVMRYLGRARTVRRLRSFIGGVATCLLRRSRRRMLVQRGLLVRHRGRG